jgi:hypothetical protein
LLGFGKNRPHNSFQLNGTNIEKSYKSKNQIFLLSRSGSSQKFSDISFLNKCTVSASEPPLTRLAPDWRRQKIPENRTPNKERGHRRGIVMQTDDQIRQPCRVTKLQLPVEIVRLSSRHYPVHLTAYPEAA